VFTIIVIMTISGQYFKPQLTNFWFWIMIHITWKSSHFIRGTSSKFICNFIGKQSNRQTQITRMYFPSSDNNILVDTAAIVRVYRISFMNAEKCWVAVDFWTEAVGFGLQSARIGSYSVHIHNYHFIGINPGSMLMVEACFN